MISCEWDDAAHAFSEGFSYVEKDGKYGYFNSSGVPVAPCEWEDACSFSEGLARVKRDGKYGYIDAAGRLAIPCEWDYAGAFDNGFAIVEKDRKLGCIDSTGKLVIPCDYDGLFRVNGRFFAFRNGYLSIFDFEGKRVF